MKQTIISIARTLSLLTTLERIKFTIEVIKSSQSNKNQKSLTSIYYPPHSILYDAYSNCSYKHYDDCGLVGAKLIMEIIRRFLDSRSLTILDWGCVPGRIIRHLSQLDDGIAKLVGSDYNAKTIKYCKQYIPGIFSWKIKLLPLFC